MEGWPGGKFSRALTRGNACAATLKFTQPSVFEADNSLGEITGLYLTDEEGELTTVDVNAKFINGQPSAIEAKYVMRSTKEWDRFMRFMERYATENELGFSGVSFSSCSCNLCLV
jgi:photosystem II reaction center protein Psb28